MEHDCVIYPQLGAFIATYVPSKWVEEEEIFLPPTRALCFNQELSEDDNFFISSLAKRYHISESEAQILCTDYLENIRQELSANGFYEIGCIGILQQEVNEKSVTFVPCTAGITSPDLYGLDAFHMTAEHQAEEGKATSKPVRISDMKSDEHNITIRINRNLFNYVAAVAASIILFFSFSTPVQTGSEHEGLEHAGYFIPANLMPHATIQHEVFHTIAEPCTENQNESSLSKEECTNIGQDTNPTQELFAIVLASAITRTNAENYVSNLKQRGYQAEIQTNGKLIRVVIPGFSSKDEAQEKVRQMKQSEQEFDKIWVMKL